MPYQRCDDESDWDDDGDLSPDVTPRPSGTFDYEPAEELFEPSALAGPAAIAYAMLIDAGATRFRGTYDGGHDEGFAHADTVWFGDDPRSIEAVADSIATPGLHARLVAAAHDPKASHWGGAAQVYGDDAPADAVARALDEVADAMASALLGEGYGTGEYELYGAFVVGLPGGEIVDDPAAGEPPSRY